MNIPKPNHRERQETLNRQRREALAAGQVGQWYSLMGDVYHPDDPQKARQFVEQKLSEALAQRGDRIFIEGTAIPRVVSEQDEWV
jgi:hypothetical protein